MSRTPPAKPARRKMSLNSPVETRKSETSRSRAYTSSGAYPLHDTESLDVSASQPQQTTFLSSLSSMARDKTSRLQSINITQRRAEFEAAMQERLPEWKQRGMEISTAAREQGLVWGERARGAMNAWMKQRDASDDMDSPPESPWDAESDYDPAWFHVFGAPIQTAIDLTGGEIPAVVERCICYLDDLGIDEVGIYRKSGSSSTITKLKETFDCGSEIDFFQVRQDPHAVAALLKLYLRELPEPLVPEDIAAEINDIINDFGTTESEDSPSSSGVNYTKQINLDRDVVEQRVRVIASRLPPPNACLLNALCHHLARVNAESETNKMNLSNLALIFSPTMNVSTALFRCFVSNAEILFGRDILSVSSIPIRKQSSPEDVPSLSKSQPQSQAPNLKAKRSLGHIRGGSDGAAFMIRSIESSNKSESSPFGEDIAMEKKEFQGRHTPEQSLDHLLRDDYTLDFPTLIPSNASTPSLTTQTSQNLDRMTASGLKPGTRQSNTASKSSPSLLAPVQRLSPNLPPAIPPANTKPMMRTRPSRQGSSPSFQDLQNLFEKQNLKVDDPKEQRLSSRGTLHTRRSEDPENAEPRSPTSSLFISTSNPLNISNLGTGKPRLSYSPTVGSPLASPNPEDNRDYFDRIMDSMHPGMMRSRRVKE
ncbi:hypothetical protein BZG36_00906 [Bifiguratus adelaidae]|uniref:Rho-GAP domain-containing protein n=1 Tax=Bifiguratus adelaidae TaxID=1938954 RepID=A0A261Y5D7_9FUNG|nr:hypothetical protein BZG36_00906 [Bifiguratus adelaidae]